MKSVKPVNFDEVLTFYDLADYLGIEGPDEGLDPFDMSNQEIDFSGWLMATLWNAMEQGKAEFPRELKLRILAGVYFAEDYHEFESVQEDWDLILDRFNAIEPVLSDDEIDEFYEKHPEVAILRL